MQKLSQKVLTPTQSRKKKNKLNNRVEVEFNGKILWSGDQRRLFRKNGKWRTESQNEIMKVVQDL
jgi:hypothetical protein